MAGFLESFQKFPSLGEVLALSSALLWAIAVILFRISGKTAHPVGMNLFKNILSTLFLGLTILSFKEPILPPLPWQNYGLFVLSGVIGIALSDTLLFAALKLLGAELVAIVDCSYSPFIIGLSFLFLGERMTGIQAAGVILIVFAVFLITQQKNEMAISRKVLIQGIILGILAMLSTAVGIVMIKPLLGRSSLLLVSFFRMTGGALSLGIFLAFHPKRHLMVEALLFRQNLKLIIPASFLGGYLSLVAWLGGMKYTQASVASALNQLNTIFIFILAAIFLKEKLTPWKVMAILSAFVGAFLVYFF